MRTALYRSADHGQAAIDAFTRRRAVAAEVHGRLDRQNRRALLASALAISCILVAVSWRFVAQQSPTGREQADGGVVLSGQREAMRSAEQDAAAFRFGEVRIPLRRNLCTAYALDNWSGFFTGERVRECYPEEKVVRVVTPATDGAARLRGVRDAFR